MCRPRGERQRARQPGHARGERSLVGRSVAELTTGIPSPTPHIRADVVRTGMKRASDECRYNGRQSMEALGISARQQFYPNETPYSYKPPQDAGLDLQWGPEAKEKVKDYNLWDLSI